MKHIITCNQCVYWDRDRESEMKPCKHGFVDSENASGFGVYNGEPYNGGEFLSGPDFGCIHGELYKL